MVQVSELMSSNVLTLTSNASLGRAFAEMKLARIRHFPVVNAEGSVVGVVSSLDIARAMPRPGYGKSIPVASLMTTQVHTVREDRPAWHAARLMRTKKIGSLPVVNAKGQLVGIITETDFIEVAEQALKGQRLRRTRA